MTLKVARRKGSPAKPAPKSKATAKPTPKSAPGSTRAGNRSVIPSGQADAPQRRKQILLAAAELFAMHGYHGTSVRDIAQRAQVPIALCSYYYGKKDELFSALFEQNQAFINDRIAALNDIATGPKKSATLEAVVRAWIEPVVRMRADPERSALAILTARTLVDPSDEAKAVIERFFDPVAFAFLSAIQRILPDRDPVDLTWGYEWAVGMLNTHVVDRRVERLSRGRAVSGDVNKLDVLINFICTGLRSIPAEGTESAR